MKLHSFILAGLGIGAVITGRTLHASEPLRRQTSASREIGAQFLKNLYSVTGADGATAVRLPNCDALWVFGDTIEGEFDSIRGLPLGRFLSNSAAVVPPQDPSAGIKHFRFVTQGNRIRQLVPFVADEDASVHRVWAIHGAVVDGNLFLFYHRISLLKDVDVFVNFQLDGMGIARADIRDRLPADWEFERLIGPDGTHEIWKRDEPTFGVWIDRDDSYCYVWGSLLTGMYLARVEPQRLGDRKAYEYLVSVPNASSPEIEPRWSRQLQTTAPLFDAVPNEMSACWNRYLQRFIAIHAFHRDGDIVMRTAPHRWGPWSEPEVIHHADRATNEEFVYAAKEHPELQQHDGRVLYLTYVNSGSYIPRLVEVTLR